MFTRARAKQTEGELSDSDSYNSSEMLNAENTVPNPGQQDAALNAGQVSALLASLNTLRESVEELRKETSRGQAEIQQLRAQVADGASTNNHQLSPPPRRSTGLVQQLVPSDPSPLPPQNVPSSLRYNGALSMGDNASSKLYPLPAFGGNPEDWPLFQVNFRDTTAEFGYNHRQNLMRLHKALHGSAKDAVTSLLIYSDDVPKVMEELEFNFGRPDLLIKSQLQKVQQFPSIYENRLEHVLDFANRVRNIVAFFKSAQCEHHLTNPILLEQLIGKLPPSKQFDWSRHVANIKPFPTLETFSNWISDLAKVVALMPSIATASWRTSQTPAGRTSQGVQQPSANRQATAAGGGARRVLHSSESAVRQQPDTCLQCSQCHGLSTCRQFKALKTNAKWEVVKRHKLCFACLQQGHNLTTCPEKKACGINGCSRCHHQLLHQNAAAPTQTTPPPSNEVGHVLNCHRQHQSTLFKILPVTICGPQGSLPVYAMLDEGSSVSLLQEEVAKKLGLKGRTMPLTLQWYGQKKTTENSRKVALTVKGLAAEFALKNVRTVRHLNLPVQSLRTKQFRHLKSLPITEYTEAKPVLLLGLDNSYLSACNNIVQNGPDQPIAAETKLGWVVYGPLSHKGHTEPRLLHVTEAHTLKQLNKIVDDFLSTENFGVRSTGVIMESDEDKRARHILSSTTKDVGRRFEVGLLWRQDKVELPDSYAMAHQRLRGIEGKMGRNAKFAAAYQAEMAKYINEGYARLLSPEEADEREHPTWYLPHFGVVNPHKPQKLRIVFDAAAKASNVSLNSVLLKGPDHAQPLLAIMHKFRQGQIAVSADIKEMFSQVKVRPADQNAQRFLWRDGKSEKPVRVYVMTSMIFGAACSPCCAEYIKNLNASQLASLMPAGAKAVIEKTYVDDLVISFDSAAEAETVSIEAVKINAAAGFTLRRFVSNCKELQLKLNGDGQVQANVISMEYQPSTDKVLGLYWNSNSDTFEFLFKFHKIPQDVLVGKRSPTKREMLGIVMSIYDPFGFLANVTLFTKLLVQVTWKRQIQWDDVLPDDLKKQWFTWWNEFQRVKHITVPRCYSENLPIANEIQLHVFVDASSKAYASVAYLRIKANDQVDVAFVAAKTRCAPIKGMTIPRLELQAAVLGSRLSASIEKCHEFHIDKVTYWSDSQTVLLWVRSTTRQYKQFVACRIAELLAATEPAQWRWIPTTLNAADDATRAKLPIDVDSVSRWLMGPTFLHLGEEQWPQEPTQLQSEHCGDEETQFVLISTEGEFCIEFTKFSSYWKMLRVLAWVLRFINNTRSALHVPYKRELTSAEIDAAEKLICRRCQEEAYTSEIRSIQTDGRVPKSSSLYLLSPFLDDDGLLKLRGRIDAAYCLPITARQPIILPQHHRVSGMVMEHYHQKRHHQNDCLIINEMRQKFWVPRARTLLNEVKKRCPVCIMAKARPATPLMGQLPSDRLTPFVRPFTYAGVDYCGPFSVAVGRRREKRWIALFTCLTTRAVHLEIADELSTSAFLLCLRNFMNRRGTPVRMRSDNGTNFVGAQKELTTQNRLFDVEELSRYMAKERIEWVFNCPANPSSGGCWERLVQCVKRVLSRVLKEEAPKLETFRSVVIEAENIINSRPLTDLPMTLEDEEPLTPNHFLLGCLNSTQTPALPESEVCLRKQWRIAQNLKDRFWRRWTVEYLPQLLRRTKWKHEVRPLQLGQLVVICDPSLPRSRWEKGKIVEVFTAKDGQVRSAEVLTKHGRIRRPASKLAALRFADPKDPPGERM